VGVSWLTGVPGEYGSRVISSTLSGLSAAVLLLGGAVLLFAPDAVPPASRPLRRGSANCSARPGSASPR
jgi:hypothetical protein